MKPVTQRDHAPFAPNQVPFELTAAERSQAAVYTVDLDRQRRARNKADLAGQAWRPHSDGSI